MNIDVVIVIKMAEPPGKERRENKNNQHVNRRHDDTHLENLHVFPTRAYKFENFHAHLVRSVFSLRKLNKAGQFQGRRR